MLVSISTPKVDVEELREKLKGEMETQNKQPQVLVNSLVTGKTDLKLGDIEKHVQEMRKSLD